MAPGISVQSGSLGIGTVGGEHLVVLFNQIYSITPVPVGKLTFVNGAGSADAAGRQHGARAGAARLRGGARPAALAAPAVCKRLILSPIYVKTEDSVLGSVCR